MKTTAIDNTTLGDRLRDLLVQFWPIDKLIPYARNARTHTEEQVAQVAASIVGVRLDESDPGRRGRHHHRGPRAPGWRRGSST